MSDQASFISQIKEEEAKAAKMLEGVEADNDKRLSEATAEAEEMVLKAEEAEKEAARAIILKAKEEAKGVYADLIAKADNARRDTIETGKTKLAKGKSHVVEAFMAMFN